jgi:ribose-phosphate pyrophosphokinase
MLSLNLVYQEKSQIEYKISEFPDGQQDITILSDVTKLQDQSVRIESRFNSFKDLELFICAANALRRMGVKERHLYIPYLLGARSDRQFVTGGNSYLVDIIAPQLNQTVKEMDGEVRNLFSSVTVMDVHSDVAPACINNLKMIDNKDLVMYVWDYLVEKNGGRWKQPIVLSPDGGALKKIYKVTEKIGFTGNVVTCSKFRDTDGKLSMTHVPLGVHDADKDLVIIDDICDGGRTFINIVDAVNKTRGLSSVVHPSQYGKIYLIVTHGIFSAGHDSLSEKFDGIFCTNSVKDITRETMELDSKNKFELIQMNVF